MGLLRRIERRTISPNPETHEMELWQNQQELHDVNDQQGGVETLEVDERIALGCGCFGEPGGRCSESGCGRANCVQCFTHCGGNENPSPEGCGKGLCREHAHYVSMPDGRNVAFCKRCRERIRRKKVWRSLLSVFVVEDHND